jgi:transmembrane protein TMEM174 (potassium channel)
MSGPAESLPAQSQGERHFRWRGGGVSRIEGLSDGVFALALTLLVVSLNVPADFADLLRAFGQVPVFLLTYAMFGWVWFLHHQFHRRFGLEDPFTITWNLVLLFVVLLYVYPLRFLAMTLCLEIGIVDARPHGAAAGAAEMNDGELQALMLLYGAGFVAMFGALTLLYRHAWDLRDTLGLDARERVLTRGALREMIGMSSIGLLSMALSATGPGIGQMFAGFCYWTAGLLYWWSGKRTDRELKAALEQGAAATTDRPPGG